MAKPKCPGTTRAGGPCTKPAGWGTDHAGVGTCKFHLGSTRNHQRAAQKELARIECQKLGVPIQVDAGEALLQGIYEAAGNAAFYKALVQELPTHPEPDTYDSDSGRWERGNPGIYGRTYHVSGVPTGEAKPHILVTLYNQECDRRNAVAAAALKAGVDQRRVEIEQQRAELMADMVRRLVEDPELDLTAAQRVLALRKAAGHLRLIEGGNG